MIIDNLKLIDLDEHLRPMFNELHKELIEFAKKYDLTLDLASSDVCIYLEDNTGSYIGLG